MTAQADDWLDEGSYDRLAEARRRKRESILAQIASTHVRIPAADPTAVTAPDVPSTSTASKRPLEAIGPSSSSDPALNSSDRHSEKPLWSSHPQEVDGNESDEEDMFAIGSAGSTSNPVATSSAARTAKRKEAGTGGAPTSAALGGGGHPGPRRAVGADAADDAEGYYPLTLGEALDAGRYVVEANLGKGMFSSVVRAKDISTPGEMVAIKIMRSQESMYKAGLREVTVLERILEADPQNKGHVVRLLRQFVHRGHLCLVFESLSMNLRQVVKRFGQGVGLHIDGVRAYAHQSLLALHLLSKVGIVHADLKPDNILVTESKAVLKVCDLGSAGDAPANAATGLPTGGSGGGGRRVMEIAPYLVSRFYRAPEIMLGFGPPGCEIDMWSLGCTLFELYTARILFPGRSNNHMLYLFQRLRGRFPTRMARRGQFARLHFDDLGNFLLRDSGTVKSLAFPRPLEDMRTRLGLSDKRPSSTSVGKAVDPPSAAAGPSLPPPSRAEERQLVETLANLLERMLELDPAKRITPKEALSHPFFAAHHVIAA